MKTLQIVGRKKSGKTSLIVRLIPPLREQGIRVGSVKHTSQPHPLDASGTDSHKHRLAGAEATLVLTPGVGALHFGLPERKAELDRLPERYLSHLDVVLIEGWKERAGPKLEILSADENGRPLGLMFHTQNDLVAVVIGPLVRTSPGEIDAPVCFGWEEIEGIASFVADWTRSV